MLDHLLVPLDGSTLAERALPHAATLALAFDSRVTVLHSVERRVGEGMTQAADPLTWQMRKAEALAYLDQVVSQLRQAGVRTDRLVVEGNAAEQIVDQCQQEPVDLIVLTSHGQGGLSEWNISSVVQKVIQRAYVPILIVPAYRPVPGEVGAHRYDRIAVPLDGSQRAEHVLPLAEKLSGLGDGTLLLVHVVARPHVPRWVPLGEEEQQLVERLTNLNRVHAARYLEDLASRLSARVETQLLVADSPTIALHEFAETEEVDLIVMSAHGSSGMPRWPYGSVTLSFVAYGTAPLLLLQDVSKADAGETEAEKAAREIRGH
jgi:nucleotide-binding universal stress UspA family protein